jgi:hypothetical protein
MTAKTLHAWLICWLDRRFYAARWHWSCCLWASLACKAITRYHDRYAESPMNSGWQ